MNKIFNFLSVFCLVLVIAPSCQKEQLVLQLSIQGYLDIQTRANESGFEDGDQVGIYVVDNVDGSSGTLSTTANHANNVKFAYSSIGNIWAPIVGSEIYWNDSKTKVDIYSYYPYSSSVGSVTEYPFSVYSDQSISGNYFNSDFLWAKASSVTAQTDPVNIYFGHRMSKIVISTTAGAGFIESEFNAATKSVQILGTKLSSKINLSSGAVSVDNSTVNGAITPKANGNVFTAVLVPQTIAESTVLFKITVNGVEYYYSKGFTFESNKQYNFTVSVNKNSLSVVSNGISEWTSDGNVYSAKQEFINKDIDGNIYTTVKIGIQTWMKEDLKTTKYRNGDPIGTTTPATLDIKAETAPKYQWAYAGNESNVATYGRLYTWYAATDSRGICPTGWHVPSKVEMEKLGTYLGGEWTFISDVITRCLVGGKLKEIGTNHWVNPNSGATNETGFTGLPSGYHSRFGPFGNSGADFLSGGFCGGNWWTSTDVDPIYIFAPHDVGPNYAFHFDLRYDNTWFQILSGHKKDGYAVRCLRDF